MPYVLNLGHAQSGLSVFLQDFIYCLHIARMRAHILRCMTLEGNSSTVFRDICEMPANAFFQVIPSILHCNFVERCEDDDLISIESLLFGASSIEHVSCLGVRQPYFQE